MSDDPLAKLDQQCRHAPKMGGNREQIMLTCSLVRRFIMMAHLARIAVAHMNPESSLADSVAGDIEREWGYLEGELEWMKKVQGGQ